jgi:membrane-associated phospholipid phosphatase
MEANLLLWFHAHASPALDAAFRLSHFVGAPPVMVALAALMALWHGVRRERAMVLLWVALGLSTVGVQVALKYTVLRPRPELWPRLVSQDGFSFPSGHALGAATMLPLLAASVSRSRRSWAPAAFVVSIVLAAWIGLGRLYLGVHWPSDVLAGWTMGALQSTFALRWLSRRDQAGTEEPTGDV